MDGDRVTGHISVIIKFDNDGNHRRGEELRE